MRSRGWSATRTQLSISTRSAATGGIERRRSDRLAAEIPELPRITERRGAVLVVIFAPTAELVSALLVQPDSRPILDADFQEQPLDASPPGSGFRRRQERRADAMTGHFGVHGKRVKPCRAAVTAGQQKSVADECRAAVRDEQARGCTFDQRREPRTRQPVGRECLGLEGG